MNGFVSNFKAALANEISKRWPDIQIDLTFEPIIDLTLGDLSASCAFSLAAATRTAPEAIVAELVASLPAEFKSAATVHAGYINILLPEIAAAFELEWHQRPARGAEANIIFVPPAGESEALAYARLLASGLLQAEVLKQLGVAVSLELSGQTKAPAKSAEVDFQSFFERGLTLAKSARLNMREKLTESLSAAQAQTTFLWLGPETLSQQEFSAFYRQMIEPISSVTLRCPERRWLMAGRSEPTIDPHQLSAAATQAGRSFLMLLAGPLEARDLDLLIVQREEKANLFWFLNSLMDRLERLRGSASSRGAQKYVPAEFSAADLIKPGNRELLIRLAFLERFRHRLAGWGEVKEYISVLADFLSRANRLINDPTFRKRELNSELACGEEQILAGVAQAMSGMMTLVKPS